MECAGRLRILPPLHLGRDEMGTLGTHQGRAHPLERRTWAVEGVPRPYPGSARPSRGHHPRTAGTQLTQPGDLPFKGAAPCSIILTLEGLCDCGTFFFFKYRAIWPSWAKPGLAEVGYFFKTSVNA